MKLDTHEGVFADPAAVEDIARAVAGLTEVGAAFIVLNDDRDDMTFIQAAGTVDEDFLVEYRDSEAGDHFCGDRRAKIAELVVLLTLYQPAPSA